MERGLRQNVLVAGTTVVLAALDYGYFGDDIILPAAQGPRCRAGSRRKASRRRDAAHRRFLRVGQPSRSDDRTKPTGRTANRGWTWPMGFGPRGHPAIWPTSSLKEHSRNFLTAS